MKHAYEERINENRFWNSGSVSVALGIISLVGTLATLMTWGGGITSTQRLILESQERILKNIEAQGERVIQILAKMDG